MTVVKPLTFINVVFLVLSTSIFVGVFFSLKLIFSRDGETLKSYFLFLGFGGVLLNYIYNVRRHVSEDYYREAKNQLEKAFEIINYGDDIEKLPRDRLSWMTVARMIKYSEKMGDKIMMRSHKDLYALEYAFWRVKFIDIIEDFPDSFLDFHYEHFSITGGEDDVYFDRALLVVSRFMRLGSIKNDPLKEHIELGCDEEGDIYAFGGKRLFSYFDAKKRFKEDKEDKQKGYIAD
ncbi:hypothetical protein BSF37_16765 [Serratia marcescens]|nr:hypothetical protein [Serratia marcescens]